MGTPVHQPQAAAARRFGRGIARAVGFAAGLAMMAAGTARAQLKDSNPHGKIDVACTTCHTADGWRPVKIQKSFNHAYYGFPLDGGHGSVTCGSCHKSLVFSQATKTCASCHQDIHRGELGVQCADCHNTRSFTDRTTRVAAHALTRFPLEGAHRTVDCRNCHASRSEGNLVFRGLPTDCIACHQREFDQTTSPNHPAAGFKKDCTGCHTNVTWQGGRFDHQTTQFPLTGAHLSATCDNCHADRIYRNKPTTCVSCHQGDYTKTSQPPHQAAGFPTDCATCHTTTKWPGAIFDHNKTQFPLTGAHVPTPCMQCHADGVYKGKPTACLSCHLTDYNNSSQPPHKAAGFPTTCTACHTTIKWIPSTFDHNASQFPLTGAHLATPCMQCHADGVYKGKPTACITCHQPDFDNSTDPNHKAAAFPTTCATCHTTTKWPGVPYNHGATQFPLTGAHIPLRCKDCHADGVYKGKPTTCVSCHQADYTKTTQPPHQAAGFPTTCLTCHTTTQWPGATFNHNATQFPLTGTHAATPCMQCHADGVYKGKPTTCVSCHQIDYNTTTNPNHTAAKFPTTCASCHNTVLWAQATFNHDGQYFPIYSGNHSGQWQSCATCHTNPTDFTVFTCLVCHEHSRTTMDPKHSQVSGYQYNSTKCYSCHPRG